MENTKRVQKYLSEAGYCSRRNAEMLISEGKVHKNGVRVKLGDKCVDSDTITVNNKPVLLRKKHQTFVFYKPKGVQTTLAYLKGKQTLAHFRFPVKVFPVGRLDKDSHGLLLMTTDGDMANKLMHPRYHHPKTYIVEVTEKITPKMEDAFKKGIRIDDKHLAKANMKVLSDTTCEIVLHEGRKRQIRRMFTAVENEVVDLKRTSFCGITLKNLTAGKFYEILDIQKVLPFTRDLRK